MRVSHPVPMARMMAIRRVVRRVFITRVILKNGATLCESTIRIAPNAKATAYGSVSPLPATTPREPPIVVSITREAVSRTFPRETMKTIASTPPPIAV